MRDDLSGLADLSMKGPGLERLGRDSEVPASLETSLAAGEPGPLRSRLDAAPADRLRCEAHLRRSLIRKGREHHQHKYAAAVLEEARRADPRWSSFILAPALDYLAHPADAETEVYRRSAQLLRDAGVVAAGPLGP
jgi:hypothetical protein